MQKVWAEHGAEQGLFNWLPRSWEITTTKFMEIMGENVPHYVLKNKGYKGCHVTHIACL